MRRSQYALVLVWLAVHALVVAAVGYGLFGASLFDGGGAALRRALIFACSVVVLIRMALTSLVLLPRAMDAGEAVAVDVWLAIIHVTFALSVAFNPQPVGPAAWIGLALFAAGSAVNTGSEVGRKRFKQRPENAGHLYTGGLFRYAMHINYFGDIVWAVGMATVAGRAVAFAIPAVMAAMFVFLHIPRLDAHLARKYGDEFERYRRKTKKLIPWVY